MKRAQKIAQSSAVAACAGRCQEAQELRQQLDEAAEVMDRQNRDIRSLIEERDRLQRQVRRLLTQLHVAESQRGLRP